MKAAIKGVGTSRLFGKQPDLHPSELIWQAVAEALADASVDRVDAVYLGTVFGAPGVAQRALHAMGIWGIPVITIENACASQRSQAICSSASARRRFTRFVFCRSTSKQVNQVQVQVRAALLTLDP